MPVSVHSNIEHSNEIYLEQEDWGYSYKAYRYNGNGELLEPHIASVDLMVDYSVVVFGYYSPLDFNVPPSYEYFVQRCSSLAAARDYIASYGRISSCEIIDDNGKICNTELYDITEIKDNIITLELAPGFNYSGDTNNIKAILCNSFNQEISYMIKGSIVNVAETERGCEVKLLTDGWHYTRENGLVIRAEALDINQRM